MSLCNTCGIKCSSDRGFILCILLLLQLCGAPWCHHRTRTTSLLKTVFFAVDQVTEARRFQLCHLSPGIFWTNSLWTTEVKLSLESDVRNRCVCRCRYIQAWFGSKVVVIAISCLHTGRCCCLSTVTWLSLRCLVSSSQALVEGLPR